ncbi:hypothetical protein NKJ13_07780 [Mesorhizobium sp. M0174]|uniref:hypothetical protein n=1 Tax=Mesorhizobium sp. M0174 TaxID=2956904 RepID=UPI00333DE3D3
MTIKVEITVGKRTVIVYENGVVVVSDNQTRYESGDGYFELRGISGLLASSDGPQLYGAISDAAMAWKSDAINQA